MKGVASFTYGENGIGYATTVGEDGAKKLGEDFVADDEWSNDEDSGAVVRPLGDSRRRYLRQFLKTFLTSFKGEKNTTTSLTFNKRWEPIDAKIKRYFKEGKVFPSV